MSSRAQQVQVYAAEHEALDHIGRRFGSTKEIENYIADLLASDFWLEQWPHISTVNVGRFSSKEWAGHASAKTFTIRIAHGNAVEATLLHEIAHLLCPEVGHGPEFCRTFLVLVRERMGFHAYGALVSAYSGRGCI